MSELQEKIEILGERVLDFKETSNEKIDGLADRLNKFEAKYNRNAFGGGGGSNPTGGKVNPAERKATSDFIRGRGQISAGLATDVDSSGGFTVYKTVAAEIGQVLRDGSPMRQVAGVVPFDEGDAFEETFSVDAAAAVFVGEREARGETAAPDMKQLTAPAKEMYAAPMISQRLIDDSKYDLVNWLVKEVTQAFAETENTAFLLGDGDLGPRGALTYPTEATSDSSRDWGTMEHVVSGDASGFAGANPGDCLIDLMMKLKVGYRPNGMWMMNRNTAATIRKFKDGNGNYLWETSYVSGQPDQLLGFPVVLNEAVPDIAANSLPVLFGDFAEGYRIVEKPTMRILIDPYTNKPNVIVYVYARVGGAVKNFHALKALKIST